VYYANTADTFGTLSAPTRTLIASGTFTVNSSVSRYSAKIAIPGGATTGLEVVLSVGAQTSGTWTIGNAQLEIGSTASLFERVAFNAALGQCQRYFQSTRVSSEFAGTWITGQAVSTKRLVFGGVLFPVVMRASPLVTLYSCSADTPNQVTPYNAVSLAVGDVCVMSRSVSQGLSNRIDQSSFTTDFFTVGDWYSFSYEADAELQA
jgi:hypothetical protein